MPSKTISDVKSHPAPPVKSDWPRADPKALARFDPASKICTMNCGPHAQDPRKFAERIFLCTDCETNKELS